MNIQKILNLGNDLFQDGFINSVISIIVFGIVLYIVYKSIERYLSKKQIGNNKSILNIVRGLFSILLFFFGFSRVIMFQNLTSTLAASSGIIALVIGIAAQDTIGNLVSGIMVVVFKPFVIGDLIKINGEQLIGFVEEITLRHTIIKTYESNRIIVPNNEINKATIENANLVDTTKGNYFFIPVSYKSNIDRAVEIISEECIKHPSFIDPRTREQVEDGVAAVIVRCVDFHPRACMLRCILQSENSFVGFEMLSDLRFTIKKRFDEEGIEIPFNHNFIEP